MISIFSVFLVLYIENERRPFIEFLTHHDEPTPDNQTHGHMWYHIKVRNKKPRFRFLNRDAALQCVARIEFVDTTTMRPLSVGQITAHWTSQPEPRSYSPHNEFDPGKVPASQRLDVGFREEAFDVVIKFRGQRNCFATDPWVVYDLSLRPDPRSEPHRLDPYHEKWEKLRITHNECVLRIEIEAINLGKRQEAYYRLYNQGTELGDLRIGKIEEDVSVVQSRLNTREASTLTFATVATSASLVVFGIVIQGSSMGTYPWLPWLGSLFVLVGFVYRELTIHTVDKRDYEKLPRESRQGRNVSSFMRGLLVRFLLLLPIAAWFQAPNPGWLSLPASSAFLLACIGITVVALAFQFLELILVPIK